MHIGMCSNVFVGVISSVDFLAEENRISSLFQCCQVPLLALYLSPP